MASPVGVPVDLVVIGAPARPGWGTTLGRFIRRKPLGAAGGAIMLVMLVTAVLAPWLQTHDPIATDAAYTLGRPNAEHWLGTDHLGRDIYSRIVHGAWVSLVVGTGSTVLGSAGQRHPRRGDAVVPRHGHPGAVPLVGAHALGLRRRVRAEGAAPRAVPRHRHQPRRLRQQLARRCAAGHAGPAAAGLAMM